MRRASSTGDESSPTVSRMRAASSSHSGCSSCGVCRGRAVVGRDELLDPVDQREAQDLRGVDEERVAAAAVDRLGQLRAACARARRSSRGTATTARRPPSGRRRAAWSRRRSSAAARRSTRRSSRAAAVPGGHPARPGSPLRARCRATRRDGWIARRGRRRRRRPASHPPSGRGAVLSVRARGPLRIAVEAPAQQRRRHDRRDQHDEQQRGVEVAAEDALVEPDGGEDQPDLAPGDHADADQPLVAGRAERPDRGDELADDRDHEQARRRSRAPRG